MNQEYQLEKRAWLSEFLWHWQDSGALTGEAAEAVLHVLEQEPGKTGPCQYPDPKDLLQGLETS